MNRREITHIAILLLVATIVRWLALDHIAIWADIGFYQYDSQLILQGQTPFIDFLGRSPTFNYLYAVAVLAVDQSTRLLRMFMHLWWMVASIPTYLIARKLHSHAAGLVAMAFLLLTPFGLTYGTWTNTQSVAAAFAITAVALLIYDDAPRWHAVAGILLGVAYLSRRSIIVILFAVLLYTVYAALRYEWRGVGETAAAIAMRVGATAGAFLVTLFAIYGAMAQFDPETTWALFEIHSINLFFSYGRGGYPLVGVKPPLVTNSLSDGHIPILNHVCQMCGAWTAKTFAKTTIASMPVIGLLWVYMRDLTEHYFSWRDVQYMYGVLGILTAYGLVSALRAGFPARAGIIASMVLLVVVLYQIEPLDRDLLYSRPTQFVLVVLMGLTAGYLYRRRILHTYYFMDFWPYLSIIGGVVAVESWQLARRHTRVLLAAAIVTGTVASAFGAYPLMVVVAMDNDAGWFTEDNLAAYEQDLNERTEPGDRVLAGNPSYVALSHAEMPMDRPRLHMVAVRYKDSGPSAKQYRHLNEGIRKGTYEYAIVSQTVVQMLKWNETFHQLFVAHYCHVESADSLYQHTDAYLYRWVEDSSNCEPTQRANVTALQKDLLSTSKR